MDAPNIDDIRDKLRSLHPMMGSWEGDEQLNKTALTPAAHARGSWTFDSAVNGAFLVVDYVEEGGMDMRGHGVIGFDKKRNNFTLHWFDNVGSPPNEPGRGEWKGGELAFTHGDHGRTIFGFVDGALAVRIEMNLDGKGFQPVLQGTYHRPRESDYVHV